MTSYSKGPDASLIELPIYAVFTQTARRVPGNDALIVRHQRVRLSWMELLREVDAVGGALHGMGLRPGDRVGIWSTNCREWILLQFAAARNGIVLVNVNPAYRSHELAYVAKKSGIRALFLKERDARANYRAIVEEAAPGLRAVYFEHPTWDEMMAGAVESDPARVSNADVANIQYTSGTTGNPKGVLLTHRNLVNNGRLIAERLGYTEADRICIPVPMYHCFGCVIGSMASVTSGAAMILPSPTFDAGAALEAVHEERATSIYGVPTMFISELDHKDFARFDLSSLRTGVMAGAPCPVEVMKRVNGDMHCGELTIIYGQTESSPAITGSKADDPLEVRVSTVGSAFPATEVKIVDESGVTVDIGEQGELCTRGYLVMKGYDQEPEATAAAINEEGWLHTGDLARMREDGNFRITGRKKDMIIRGGENIYPREIEEFLYGHPKVADVQVVGLPDVRLGEVVAAWIRLKPGETATEHEIKEHCRGRIAHYKVPQFVRFVSEFPMTVTGKIQKFKIREAEIEARNLKAAARIETA
ncbi:MAG TPA: AMP-binding protein [Bryobacteraceae bacterium]|jgi:fatty-acyl-CoA synthase